MTPGRSSWTPDRERASAAALSAVAVAAIGYALVSGLAVSLPVKPADVMRLFTIAPPTPPPREKPPPPHPRHAERERASAPPNTRSTATPVVARTPVIPLPPPPVIAAPVPATGLDARSGAAPVAGPGTGAGGIGNGLGSGRGGNGRGDGGTPARVVRKIRFTDLSTDVRQALSTNSEDYVVGLRFTVGVNGRLTDCTVVRSSGYPALDVATCQAALRNIRYTPERDANGRPVAVVFTGTQEWPARHGGEADRPDDD